MTKITSKTFKVNMIKMMLTISYSSPRLAGLLLELPLPPGPKPEAFSEACRDPDHNNQDQDKQYP